MSNALGGSSDGIPAKYTSESSLPNEPAVSLATFRFKKIGQPPALLQRMSASGRNDGIPHLVQPESRSPSPDLEDELLFSDSSPYALSNNLPPNNGQASLRARIAMSEPLAEENENMDIDIPNHIQHHGTSAIDLRFTDDKSKSTGPSTLHRTTTNTALSNNDNVHRTSLTENISSFSGISGPSSIRRVSSADQAMPLTNYSETSRFPESSTLKALRDLQTLLSSSDITTLSADISDAIRLGETIKDQSAIVLSTARNAQELAHQSIASARESLEESVKSLAAAESLQTRADELMASIKRINPERDKQWTNVITPFATRLTQIIQETDLQEKSNAEAQLQHTQNAAAKEVTPQVPHQASVLPMDNSASKNDAEDALHRIQHEASIASQELLRNREEAEARQRAAEEALRQRREAEEVLEHQRQRAQAELQALEEQFKQAQIERLAAEERERLRQEEEIRLMKSKEEEQKRKEEQAVRLAVEERSKRASLALQEQQAQHSKLAREAAVRERLENEKLVRDQRLQEEEKELLRQQELKRQEIRDQKVRANTESAQRIQARRAQNIPPSQDSSSNHDTQIGQPAVTPPSVPALFTANNVHSESDPSSLGGIAATSVRHQSTSSAAKTSLKTKPLTKHSPLQKAISVSGAMPLKNLPSSSKNRSSIGLPSPPLEENKTPGSHATTTTTTDPVAKFDYPHEAVGIQSQANHILPTRSKSPFNQPSHTGPVESDKASVENINTGQRTGSLTSPSCFQTTPTSPTTRKRKSVVKPDTEQVNDIKIPLVNVKVEQESTVKTETSDNKKLKFNSPSDYRIPPLSMPSPPPYHAQDESSPTSQMPERENFRRRPPFKRHVLDPIQETSSSSRIDTQLPGRMYDRTIPTATINQDVQTLDLSVLPSVSSSFPAKPLPMVPVSKVPPNHRPIGDSNVDLFDDDDRMGPDTAVPEKMIPPLYTRPIDDDPLGQRRRHMAPKVDHYSPSPPPPLNSDISRGALTRPRRGGHYSPHRRSPEPRRTSQGLSWIRRRDRNEPNARGVSPDLPVQYRANRNIQRSPSPGGDAEIGRKRNRDIKDTVGPPSNRPRHVYKDSTYTQIRGNRNTTDVRHSYEDDWSRTANYGRSPSPEPRLTPLAFRLDEAPNSERLPVQRLDANSYPDQPRRRTGGSSYNPASTSSEENVPNDAHRQNMGDRHDNSRPSLIDRFTDVPLIPAEPSHQYFGYNKGPRPRKPPYQRPPYQQPSEQRLNNRSSLIHRLQ